MNFDSSTGYKVSLSKLFNQPVPFPAEIVHRTQSQAESLFSFIIAQTATKGVSLALALGKC